MDNLLKSGDKCPDFSLFDQDEKKRGLTDYKGGYLLVYFYPKALTPGCTAQSCSVSEAYEDFSKLDCKTLGISPDSPDKQKKFEQKHGLRFPLLCDEDHSIAESFGVWGEKSMYGKKYMGIIRSSFLVDPDGRIAECWYKVSPGNTVPNAIRVLEGLRK